MSHRRSWTVGAVALATTLMNPFSTASASEPSEPSIDETTARDTEAQANGGLQWGYRAPVARWKLAGLGASATVFALSSIGAIVAGERLRGPVRDDISKAARASLTDEKPNNDVDPSLTTDLCRAARIQPSNVPGTVTNAAVTQACNRADFVETTHRVLLGTAVVGLVGTVAFTVTLFVHRDRPLAAAALRHNVSLGVLPTRGGFVAGGGLRF